MKVSGHIGMLNHKLSIPILHHLVKLRVPEQPAESEQLVKFVAGYFDQVLPCLFESVNKSPSSLVVGKYY